ncbi:inorganic pyrophosphatase [Gymnopus androsaceus JB14]|uniref:inorganic diphosphatase n=1 Tax=Gymnopus androsaceus JB14 TaxID=1447944 RepID=A0A6A4HJ39_9AGAR|nr:inorganic pyrophosphatase [Gymnopus androsaceus JB14]
MSRCTSQVKSKFTPRLIGAPNTFDHRVFIQQNGSVLSSFHDIPLFADQNNGIFNMIVEVPHWTNAKMEISREEPFNPIKQHAETKAKGDDDPLDVCEIGEQVGYVGQVKQVQVLGIMALLDEDETDWKVIVVDVQDTLASKLNDIEDVERHLPGLIRATNEWFRRVSFFFLFRSDLQDSRWKAQKHLSVEKANKKYATEIIHECHEAWRHLITGETAPGGISICNSDNITIANSPEFVRRDDPKYTSVPPASVKVPALIDPSVSKWFYISSAQV